ncbi:MAG: hypothetical protein A2Y33_09490 [Spirochaetes bacterium GWF1_51_8]|nr:MAG: hypothetical protein A2Y33_09490 [Spirochaetes bacterium GWF1_51_8]
MYLEKEAIDFFRRYDLVLPPLARRHGDDPSRILGRNLEFEQYNLYHPGDDIRDIDWKVYGRTDKLFVKNYGSDITTNVRILIDNSESMAYHGKVEIAKKIAAIMAYLLHSRKAGVWVSTVNSEYRDMGRLTLSNLEETLSRIGTSGVTSMDGIPFIRGRIVFLISDLWVHGLDPAFFTERRINLIHILTPEERELSLHGNLEMIDMENGKKLQLIPSTIRDLYRTKLRERTDELRAKLSEAFLLYDLFTTETPYYTALKRYLDRLSAVTSRGKRWRF